MIPPGHGNDDRGLDFRRAVMKGPPWFLAILIVLTVGVGLTQLVFSRLSRQNRGEAFVSLRGVVVGGGGNEEGGGEKDETEDAEPQEPREDFVGENAKFESLKWLKGVAPEPRVGPLGSGVRSAPPAPKPVPAADVRKNAGGGSGRGRGLGRGKGSPWANRSGPGRRIGVGKYGGTAASESAVEGGLDWLARHQSRDGRWDGNGYHKLCTGSSCGKNSLSVGCDVGLTGLSLMAFLGAGYTHQKGKYRRAVRLGLAWLADVQDGRGSFTEKGNMRALYNQSLAIIALAEAYGITRDPALEKPLVLGVRFLMRAQQAGGGWTYTPFPAKERNDTSITGFAVMALKSAREAGVPMGQLAMARARRHIDRMTTPAGDVIYADTGTRAGDKGAGMIAVGLFTSFLLGRRPGHVVAQKQLSRLRRYPPSWNGPDGGDTTQRGLRKRYLSISNSMYYWYYATLAHFVAGGRHWDWWNPRIRDLLVSHQRRSGCARGSWDPVALWAEDVGRIYSTALNVLTLEIYYRYIPGFLLNDAAEPWTPSVRPQEKEEGEASPEDERERLRRLRDLIKRK